MVQRHGQWQIGDVVLPADKINEVIELLMDFRRLPQEVNQSIQTESTVTIQTQTNNIEMVIGQQILQMPIEDEERYFRVVSIQVDQNSPELYLVAEMWFTRFTDTWMTLFKDGQ